MSFRTVERVTRNGAPSAQWAERRKRMCRFACHKKGDGRVMVVWIGELWAKQIGLIADRHNVDFMLDSEFPAVRKCAIRVNPNGDFRCARQGSSYGVHINTDTYAALFGDNWFWSEIQGEAVTIDGDMVVLDVPMPHGHGGKLVREAADLVTREARARAFRSFGDDF